MDTSTLLQNAEENRHNTPSSELPVETIYIEGTPFAARGNKDLGYYAMWGKFMISQKHATIEEVTEKILAKDWELILNAGTIIAHSVYGAGVNEIVKDIHQQEKQTTND